LNANEGIIRGTEAKDGGAERGRGGAEKERERARERSRYESRNKNRRSKVARICEMYTKILFDHKANDAIKGFSVKVFLSKLNYRKVQTIQPKPHTCELAYLGSALPIPPPLIHLSQRSAFIPEEEAASLSVSPGGAYSHLYTQSIK
jgi:hypothetical protein